MPWSKRSAIPKKVVISTKTTQRKGLPSPVWDSKEKAIKIAQAVLGKKGEDIVLLYVGEVSTLADYMLISSANSEPQIWAIVDAVETVLIKNHSKPLGIEGAKASSWVLVDCGDLIVHIFRQETRRFYNLDGLWADAPRMDLMKTSSIIDAPKVQKRRVI